MDGSYGNVFPANSPMSPMAGSSSGGDAYKVNVSRTKTKKWAEFKPQNYDGDDWGADYDEEHEEPPPVPKPLGPRQQVPAPPHLRQFQPSGAPPLQTSTQQPAKPSETGTPFASAQPATGGGPGRIAIDSAATGSSVYSPGPGFPQGGSGSGSGTPLRRVSPAPPSAGPQSIPSRFPPRKSSMGQSDAPDTAELVRQSQPNNSNSRPGSSHKPWVQARSSSPASARSPVSPTSGKPLPFVRPADIYRRMEEEKEKERRSIDSSRQSLDSNASRGLVLERVDSAPRAARSPTPESESADHRRRSGAGFFSVPEQEAETHRVSRPSLPPVAERKSEYGLDGLIASYGYASDPPPVEAASNTAVQSAAGGQSQTLNAGSGPGPGPVAAPAPSSAPPACTQTHAQTHAPAPGPEPFYPNHQSRQPQPIDRQEQQQQQSHPAIPSQGQDQDDLRRLSISPKLPDLGRMSAFGEDLFYSSVFAAGAPSPLPVIQDSPPPSASEQIPPPPAPSSMAPPVSRGNDGPTSGAEIAVPSANTQPTDSSLTGPGQTPSKDPSEKDPSEQELSTLNSKTNQDSSESNFSDQSTPSGPPPPLEPASDLVKQQAQPSRPSLPGAWVSETPTAAEDLLTPTPGAPSEQLSAQDTTHDDSDRPKHLASPHNLPPLRTGSPTVSLSPREPTEGEHADIGDNKSLPSTESAGTPQATSPEPNTASTTAHRDITPIAPLNPSRSVQEGLNSEEGDISAPALDAGSTLDTTGSSPLKESDLLSEEIIKSLSPVHAPSGLTETTGPSTAAYHSAAGPGRESSYLAGVYDDYWGAGDDNLKSELQLETPALKEQGQEKLDNSQDQAEAEAEMIPPAPTYAPPVLPNTSAPTETVPSPQVQVDSKAQPLRQRFSWEAEPEVITSPVSNGQPELRPVVVETAAPSAPEPPITVDAGHLAPTAPKSDLSPSSEPLNAGGISHQVSGASTIPPRSNLDAPIEPPSPISVLSDKVGPTTELRRLSLAEEKAGVQSSSHPVSPTPPLEEHPAMVGSAEAALPAPPRKDPVKLMPFKQILALPSAEERIKKFRETRDEFASIDTGLDEWLTTVKNSHPEYANATSFFSFRPATGHKASAQNPGQGPLSEDITEGGLPHGPIPMAPPMHGSGHHHNQVGTRSKELLAMAGKKGKGLFSKGRNKILGTGEKDPEPPAALAAVPIAQPYAYSSSTAALAAGAGRAGAIDQQFGAGETPLSAQTPFTRTSQSASTPTKLFTSSKAAASAPSKSDRRTSWAFSLGFRSSRSDLAVRPASTVAPKLLSPASASSVSLSLSGSGSAQQATRIRPLSTQGPQAAQPQLWGASARSRSSYQDPRPQFGPPAPQPLSSEKPWGASSPPLSPSNFHPSQLPFVRNNSRSQGGRPFSAPLPPLPRTSTPVNQAHHGRDNSIDRSAVLPLSDRSPTVTSSRQRRDSEVELVSPVSETFSNRPTPAPYERELSDSLRIPAPISKRQPSWDPFTGTPLVEEEDFSFEASTNTPSPAVRATTHNGDRPTLAQAAQLAPSHLVSQGGRDSTPRSSNVISADSGHPVNNEVAHRDEAIAQQYQHQQNTQLRDTESQADQMAAYAQNSNLPPLPPSSNYSQHPYNPHNAYLQHQQPQSQTDANGAPQRQTSFVGLPPIRRESALGESLLTFPSDEGNGDNNSSQPRQQHSPPPHQQQQQQQQQVQPLGAGHVQFVSMSPGQPQLIQHVYRPTQIPPQNQFPPHRQGFPTPPPGASSHQWTLRPQGPAPGGQGQGQQRSFSGAPANAPPSMMLNGGAQQINMGQGPQQQATSRPVMVPPPHMTRGFTPQAGWTVQESHLTEPLHSPNRNRSASNSSTHQPVYGFDKETGVSSSGPSGKDTDDDVDPPSGPSGAAMQQQQAQASRPQPPPSQVSPASPPGQNNVAPGMPSPEADHSDLVPPGPIPAVAQDAQARRSSGVWSVSGLKDRITGHSTDERPDSSAGPRFQGATGDAVSETSVATDNGQKKRGFFGLRSHGTGFDHQPPRSKESIIAHGPGTPTGERDQPGPSAYPPPEKKRSNFLGLGGHVASSAAPQSKLANSHTPRPSISSTTASEIASAAGSVGGPPKKRFSALTKFHRSGTGAQEASKPPATAQSSLSVMQTQPQAGQPAMGQQQQFGSATGSPSMANQGRERTESNATTRPSTAQPIGSNANHHMQTQAAPNAEHDKSKKGGLFGRFKNRDSKQAAPPAPAPAPGQPIMNQAQMSTGPGQMGHGQPAFPHGPGGPQPQFIPVPGQHGPQPQGQYFMQVPGPDGRIMMQPVQLVPRPGQPGQMMYVPQQMPMMANGQPQFVPQGVLLPNGQPGGQVQALTGQPGQIPQQQAQNQGPPHAQPQGQPQPQVQMQRPGQQTGSPSGPQQPPAPQQPVQNHLVSPGRERGNSVASPQSATGSPQIGTPASAQPQSGPQSLASPPVDASRSQNASPVSLRQPIPVPPPGSIQGTPPHALRAQPSTPTPPVNQSFARKPVQSSPKPPAEQFRLPPASSSDPSKFTSQVQEQPVGLPGAPVPPPGSSLDQPRASNTPIPQPPPGTPAQMLPQRLSQQQASPGGTANRIPQPVPVPLPTPTPQPAAQTQQNRLLQPPNQQLPVGPTNNVQGGPGQSAPNQGQPGSEMARVPSHGSTANQAGPQQPVQAHQQPQTNMATPAPIKEQSTISKIFKGALPTQPALGQEKPGKEKSKSSFFSGFKGRSKQQDVQAQPQPQTQMQGQPGQSTQQGGPQMQAGQGRPSMSPQNSMPTGPQGQGQGQPGPYNQYQNQRQSPGGSASPDGNSAAQTPAPQPTPSPNQGPAQQQQQQSTQFQQGPTGLRQPGQQMPPPSMGRGGPQGPPTNQNRGSNEPQYAQVPIPRGYGYVHAEGNVAPAPTPYYAGHGAPLRMMPGHLGQPGMPQQPHLQGHPQQQHGQPGMPQQQPWLQQNIAARQMPVPPPGQHHMYQHGQPGGPPLNNMPPQAPGQSMIPPGSAPLGQQRQQAQPQVGQGQVNMVQQQGPPQPVQRQFSPAQNPSAENSPHPSGVSATPSGLSPVSASPPPTVLSASPPPQNQFQPRPQPTGPITLVTSPPAQAQHPGQATMSPQNYPLPNTTFSPVNPAAAGMPNPPLPLGAHQIPHPQGQFQNNTGLVPQRQVSAVSQISMSPESQQPNYTISPMSHTLSGQQSHNASPGQQIIPDRTVSPEPQVQGGGAASHHHVNNQIIDSRTVSPEPVNQSLAPPPVSTPRSNRQVEDDNIYDATPRQSFLPQNHTPVQNSIAGNVMENAEASSGGQQYNEVIHSAPVIQASSPVYQQPPPPQQQQQHEPQPQPPAQQQPVQSEPVIKREQPPPQPVSEPSSPSPPPAKLADSDETNGTGPSNGSSSERPAPAPTHINGKPITSSADIFNEEKRKMLIREQEEKIPVFPTEPDIDMAAMAAAAKKKKEQEEMPQMSATSYPGQEWNPYGDGGFDGDSD